MKTIPFQQMLRTIRDLGFRFPNQFQEDHFIRTRCSIQQKEKNGKPMFVLYIDRVPAGSYQ